MEEEVEQMKEQPKQGEGEEEERIGRARAENNEATWSTYGEWKGQIQPKREEVRTLEKKIEDLKKTIAEEERKEAEKVVLEGGSDGLDEEADAEREEEKKWQS